MSTWDQGTKGWIKNPHNFYHCDQSCTVRPSLPFLLLMKWEKHVRQFATARGNWQSFWCKKDDTGLVRLIKLHHIELPEHSDTNLSRKEVLLCNINMSLICEGISKYRTLISKYHFSKETWQLNFIYIRGVLVTF
jgi:hypothetical protein